MPRQDNFIAQRVRGAEVHVKEGKNALKTDWQPRPFPVPEEKAMPLRLAGAAWRRRTEQALPLRLSGDALQMPFQKSHCFAAGSSRSRS
jgi:hypothetical protein